ncbi:MAG: hypothetical protein WKF34_04565 [Pyrinomonadaceae bacterium]
MFSSKNMPGFRKSEACPPSIELLAFEKGEIERLRGRAIGKHLTDCEFCEAEIEFYSHYPQEEVMAGEASEIPAPLFELAEALLKNRHNDLLSLNALLRENEELVSEGAS